MLYRNRNFTHPKVFDGPDFICDHQKAVFFADDVIVGNQIKSTLKQCRRTDFGVKEAQRKTAETGHRAIK